MYKVLERIILDRHIKHRDKQAGFRSGRSTNNQVFIITIVIEIWPRYSKLMQLAFLDFEAAFDSPHRGRPLDALCTDVTRGKLVRLLGDWSKTVEGPFLFNFAIDDIMRSEDQCRADIVLAPSWCPLTDLEYSDDVVIFAGSTTKLQQ
ncbi:hypothetical protein RB195_024687 [Necator americanus]|uniref:Reverse transcriptase domain-containing protein n=1 Tax=Necator americanus TaxID=51031 RepID=A0ABR1EP71_NECAM